MRRTLGMLLVLIGMTACSKSDAPDAKPTTESKPVDSSKVATTAAASAVAAPQPKLPPGRTTMPTLDEWAKMPKEVTVKGSSALGCETKILREYLRVACRGKNDTGGTPTTLHIMKGGHGEALTFAGTGVTSLIAPFVEGTDLEVVFSWTDKSHKLVAVWPKGTKQPIIVGVFEGAASPLDTLAKADAPAKTGAAAPAEATPPGDPIRLCDCFKKIQKATSCDDMMGAADADCDRTYVGDCESLLECSRGEPGRPPHCLPGFENSGAIMRCMRTCGPDKPPCGKGHTCNADFGVNVCMED